MDRFLFAGLFVWYVICRHRAAPVSAEVHAEVHAALLRGPPPQHASSPRLGAYIKTL